MANHCYNWIRLNGKKESIEKLIPRLKTYEQTNYVAEWGDYVLEKGKIGDSEKVLLERHQRWAGYKRSLRDIYGARWFDFHLEYDGNDLEELIIMGDSAWSPMIPLVQKICEHYQLDGIIEYEESGNDFAGRSVFNNKGEIVSEEDYCYDEWRYIEDRWSFIDYVVEYYEDLDYTTTDTFSIKELEDMSIEHLKNLYPFCTDEDIKEIYSQIEVNRNYIIENNEKVQN
ncbi:MAG: hypothetical protein ACTSVE_02680 [Candidatus Helarchaeota archaeon]